VRYLLLLAALAAAPAMAQIKIENAWARATPPGAKIAAGYLTMRNVGSAPDRLVSASSPAAEKVEMHITIKDGDIFRMRQVKGYELAAGATLELKPAGAHLMLVNVREPLKEGAQVPLTLRFERAGELKTELHVGRLTEAPKHTH